MGRKIGLLNIDDVKLALEAVGIAAAALQHLDSIRARRYTNENAFLHAPGVIAAMRAQIVFQLMIHNPGRHQEGQFAQAGELMLFGEQRSAIGGGCLAGKDFVWQGRRR